MDDVAPMRDEGTTPYERNERALGREARLGSPRTECDWRPVGEYSVRRAAATAAARWKGECYLAGTDFRAVPGARDPVAFSTGDIANRLAYDN